MKAEKGNTDRWKAETAKGKFLGWMEEETRQTRAGQHATHQSKQKNTEVVVGVVVRPSIFFYRHNNFFYFTRRKLNHRRHRIKQMQNCETFKKIHQGVGCSGRPRSLILVIIILQDQLLAEAIGYPTPVNSGWQAIVLSPN